MQKINQDKKCNYPKTKQAWANFINDCYDEAIAFRRPCEFQWAVNTAFYKGYHYLSYNRTTGLITGEYDSSRYIINRIAPFVESRVGKLVKSKPGYAIIPDSVVPKKIKAAELSEKVLKSIHKINRKDEKFIELMTLTILNGSAFKKVIWNSETGEAMKDDQDSEGYIVIGEESGLPEKQNVFTGEVENIVKSAFSVLPSPGSRKVADCDYIFDRSFMTVQDVMEQFEEADIDKVIASPDQMTKFEAFVHKLNSPLYNDMGLFSGLGEMRENAIKELKIVLVKEFWLKPNYYYPEGVLATVVGNQLLQFDKWPYDHKQYPFIKYDEHYNPFGFYGMSTIERLIPINKHYNQARTQLSRNAEIMANVKWWVPKGAGLEEESLTDEEGEIVETNPNVPRPEQLGVAPLPNYIIENQNQDILDLRDCGGEREASLSPFPGITAGVALETAAELADVPLLPTVRGIEQSLIQEAKLELHLANQYYTDKRTLKIWGDDNKVIVEEFNREDLDNQTDVSIQLESSLGQSKSAIRQNLIDMWDRRIITDPETFLRAFSVGNIDIILKSKAGAENVVIEQIEDIKQGKQPVISQFDNHVLHVRMLSEFIQTPEFRRLAPDRQQVGIETLQQYISFLQPQAPMPEENPAAVGTPFGSQVVEGATQQEPSAAVSLPAEQGGEITLPPGPQA